MGELGAEIVEISFDPEFLSSLEGLRGFINSEFQPNIEGYLATLPDAYPKTLEELVAIYESPEILNSPHPVNPGLVDTHKRNIEIGGLDNEDYARVIETVLPEIRNTVQELMDVHQVEALLWPTASCTATPRWI